MSIWRSRWASPRSTRALAASAARRSRRWPPATSPLRTWCGCAMASASRPACKSGGSRGPSPPGECYNVAVSQQLNDRDMDRIASRVVQKLVVYGLVIVAGIWIVPLVLIAVVTSIGYATRDLPFVLGVAIAATVIALPLVALIWIWGRRER